MKKIIPLILLLILTSCSYNEPNDIAYVVAIGFDKADKGNYDITIQFAKPTQISGGASEEGGKGGNIVENMTIESPNIYAGMNLANNILSKKFTLSHAKLIVFSEEVASEGIHAPIDTIIRSEELRPDVYIAISECKAYEYLNSVKPVIEVNPAKYYQLIYEKNDSGGIPKLNLQQFYFESKTGSKSSVAPMAGKIKTKDNSQSESSGNGDSSSQGESSEPKENENNKNAKVNENPFEYKVKNYYAGEIAIYNKNEAEANGMFLIKDGKSIGKLGGIYGELYNLLNGTLRKSFLSFKNSLSDEPITLKLDQSRRPRYKIDIKKKKIDIYLFTESDIYSIPAEYNRTEEIEVFEKEAEHCINEGCEEFIKKCRDEYDVDAMNIGSMAKRKFLTVKDFEEYKFEDKFKDFDINVHTELRIRRSGMKMER